MYTIHVPVLVNQTIQVHASTSQPLIMYLLISEQRAQLRNISEDSWTDDISAVLNYVVYNTMYLSIEWTMRSVQRTAYLLRLHLTSAAVYIYIYDIDWNF